MGATVGTATRDERRMAESQATGMTRPGVFCTAAFGKLPSGGGGAAPCPCAPPAPCLVPRSSGYGATGNSMR
jgi:hypothetical protein